MVCPSLEGASGRHGLGGGGQARVPRGSSTCHLEKPAHSPWNRTHGLRVCVSVCPCVLRAAPLLARAESTGAERALSPPCRQETRAYPKYFSCGQEGSRDQPESESSVSQPSAFKEHLLYKGTSLAAVCGEGEDHSGSCVSLGKTGTT